MVPHDSETHLSNLVRTLIPCRSMLLLSEGGEVPISQEFQTMLSYVVELEPKLWVPVRLLEGRICKEIKTNLVCIREEAERVQRSLKQTELSVFLFQQ